MEKKESLRARAARLAVTELELPAGGGEAYITLSSSEGITVRGVETIREYDGGTIVLRLRKHTLRLTGSALTVGSYDMGTVVVHGELFALAFSEGGMFRC